MYFTKICACFHWEDDLRHPVQQTPLMQGASSPVLRLNQEVPVLQHLLKCGLSEMQSHFQREQLKVEIEERDFQCWVERFSQDDLGMGQSVLNQSVASDLMHHWDYADLPHLLWKQKGRITEPWGSCWCLEYFIANIWSHWSSLWCTLRWDSWRWRLRRRIHHGALRKWPRIGNILVYARLRLLYMMRTRWIDKSWITLWSLIYCITGTT